MGKDISGQGLSINILSVPSFPAGFVVTQFADDADPLDIPDIQLNETAMGLNGDMISWNTANPIPMTINVIPGSEDDINLAVLAELNRAGRGKITTKDKIVATVIYPDGFIVSLINGKITNAPATTSVQSAGRKKSKTYTFAFENKIGI